MEASMPESYSLLRIRWNDLWRRRGVTADLTNEALSNIIFQYRGRPYHGVPHIEQGLVICDAYASLAKDIDAVRAAYILHDIDRDEETSALIMRRIFGSFGEHEPFLSVVHGLIHPGTKHRGDLTDPDQQFISDVDLCGFGYPRATIVDHSRRIRAENRTTPYPVYVQNRRQILTRFFERGDRLFYKHEFRRVFGSRALDNIRWEIDRLPEMVAQFDKELGITH
jgi:predicted metal-dependent HD superfamily phosphohydrolase